MWRYDYRYRVVSGTEWTRNRRAALSQRTKPSGLTKVTTVIPAIIVRNHSAPTHKYLPRYQSHKAHRSAICDHCIAIRDSIHVWQCVDCDMESMTRVDWRIKNMMERRACHMKFAVAFRCWHLSDCFFFCILSRELEPSNVIVLLI